MGGQPECLAWDPIHFLSHALTVSRGFDSRWCHWNF